MQNGPENDGLGKKLDELRRRLVEIESAELSFEQPALGLGDDQERYFELVDKANDAVYMTDAKGFSLW